MRTFARSILGLLVLAVAAAPRTPAATPAAIARPALRLSADPGRMPLTFIANRGQADARVDYYVAGRDEALFFTAGGVAIALRHWDLRLDFVGANAGVRPEGEEEAETVFSFFRGRPEDWRTGVPSYGRLIYRDLWPGVDLVYSGTADRLKYDLIVRPGADPSSIRLAYRGASDVSVDADGRLRVATPAGGFHDEQPVAYQVRGGERVAVPAAFRLEDGGRGGARTAALSDPEARSFGYGFEVGDYDRSLPLVLDPATVVYCGYIGSSADDRGAAVAVDASGNAYITGSAGYYDFPVTVGPDLSFNSTAGGTNAFVAKVNAAGTGFAYCGFIGGSASDAGTGIAVDASGNAYVAGWTTSQDFPAVVGPGLATHGNIGQYSDAFVAKVSADGTSLAYCGFIGGTAADRANGIAVDASGNAYIAGWTESADLAVAGGPDLSYNGNRDAFVAKVNAAGTALVYCGYVGGQAEDAATAIAVDGSGNAYVTGYTDSFPTEHFPVTVGPSLTYGGARDAFVAKVNAAGTALVYCGYIGGTDADVGNGIAVDPSGEAYVVGSTDSHFQFPVTVGPGLVHRDGTDAFVAEVNAAGTALVYCGFIGGSGADLGNAIAVDGAGIAYITGSTDSASDFPVSGGPYLVEAGAKDAFIATVSATGDRLLYSGFLGGSLDEEGAGIAADGAGNIYVAGTTLSANFPVAVGPLLTPGGGPAGGSADAFIARLSESLPPLAPSSLHATTVTSSEVDLAWTDRSTDETGFKVERKTGASGTWAEIGTVGANVTDFPDTGLNEGTTYVYRVRAYNSIGDSGSSNELSVLTRPLAPSNLTATAANERRVNLSWTDNSASETGFRVERRVGASNPWGAVGTVSANVTTFADTTVIESTAYSYRVFAFNSGGDSAPSNTATVTTPALTIPAAPSNLQASALSATSARLTWADNSYNEDDFLVERKTGAAGVWAQVGAAAADATAFTDNGLSESTLYYYRVRASNGAGASGYSNEAAVTTPANQPLLRLPLADTSFGAVNECALLDLTTTLHNDGGAPLTVTSVAWTSGSADFTCRAPATPFSIPALSSQAVTVRFSPLATGAEAAVFTVHSNDAANPAVAFNASGSGFVPKITLSLQVQRQVERAWIIRREYGRVTITVTKSAPFNVTTYRLSRRTGTGAYQAIKDFAEANLPSGTVTYIDMFLVTGTSYTYKVEALNCSGAVLATSAEGAASPPPPAPARRETRIEKR
ncbi:MAG TPA: SBBP repeat-containing protein [Terriglobales bacterium]|nr:SBBP repeat-containing protein [Terriglobales bacterium]